MTQPTATTPAFSDRVRAQLAAAQPEIDAIARRLSDRTTELMEAPLE